MEKEYENVFNVISRRPISFEEICLKVKKPANEVLCQLTMLEINGFIKEIDGKNFVKIK